MAPTKKRRGRNKKTKKNDEPKPILDAFTPLNVDQLREEVRKYSKKLTDAKRNRSYYQLDRDQLNQFYKVVQAEVGSTTSAVANLDARMEQLQDVHRNNIRMYVQKVKHLEYDHVHTVQQLEQEGDNLLEEETQFHEAKKSTLKAQKVQLTQKLRKETLAQEEAIRRLKEKQARELEKLRQEFDKQHTQLRGDYQNKMSDLKEELALRRKMQIHEVEERKNLHINDLMDNHERAFTEMRNYYNSITRDNLELIKSLKQEMVELRAKAAQNEKTIQAIAVENKKLSGPLAKAAQEVADLESKLKNYSKDKNSLKAARSRFMVLDNQLSDLQKQESQLRAEYRRVESERDRLYTTFEDTVLNVQRAANFKNDVLDRKLATMQDDFHRKRNQFTEVLREAQLDQVVLMNLTRKLDDVLDSKNTQIKRFQYEIARTMKSHDDLVRIYETKLKEFGVPDEELGVPLMQPELATSAPTGTTVL